MKNFSKKAISGILSLVIAASAAVSLPISGSAKGIAYGDINGDSFVNSSDALAALTYSVGKRDLTSDEFIRADVNADKKVNSSDALEILRYSVGLIQKFKAEGANNTSVDAKTAVTVFNKAVEYSKKILPSYTFQQTPSETVDDVKVTSNSSLISDDLLKQAAEDAKKQYTTAPKTYTKIVQQKTEESAQKMVGTFDLSRLSELASVECKKNEKGNYLLTVKFKNEKNPTENSQIVKVLGQMSYDSAKKALADNNSLDGVKAKIDAFNFTYENCILRCEINPSSYEFVSIDWSVKNVSNSKVTTAVGFVKLTVEMSMTGNNSTSYSKFGY